MWQDRNQRTIGHRLGARQIMRTPSTTGSSRSISSPCIRGLNSSHQRHRYSSGIGAFTTFRAAGSSQIPPRRYPSDPTRWHEGQLQRLRNSSTVGYPHTGQVTVPAGFCWIRDAITTLIPGFDPAILKTADRVAAISWCPPAPSNRIGCSSDQSLGTRERIRGRRPRPHPRADPRRIQGSALRLFRKRFSEQHELTRSATPIRSPGPRDAANPEARATRLSGRQ